jgi:hypothetical protein
VSIITNQWGVDEIIGNGMNNFRNITIYYRGNCLIREPNDKNAFNKTQPGVLV